MFFPCISYIQCTVLTGQGIPSKPPWPVKGGRSFHILSLRRTLLLYVLDTQRISILTNHRDDVVPLLYLVGIVSFRRDPKAVFFPFRCPLLCNATPQCDSCPVSRLASVPGAIDVPGAPDLSSCSAPRNTTTDAELNVGLRTSSSVRVVHQSISDHT